MVMTNGRRMTAAPIAITNRIRSKRTSTFRGLYFLPVHGGRDLEPAQRVGGLMPELIGMKTYQADEFKEKVEWMIERGFLTEAPNYTDVVRSK